MLRRRVFSCALSLVIIVQTALIITVGFFLPKLSRVFVGVYDKNFIHVNNIHAIDKGTQQNILYKNGLHNQTADIGYLIPKISESFGRNLQINFGDGVQSKLTFDYAELHIPAKISSYSGNQRTNRSETYKKYVFVHSSYTEQMSMSMLSVLSLCGQAQFGGRRVVRPFIFKSRFVSTENGKSLGTLFDLKYLDELLDHAGYAPMVSKKEYVSECKPTDPNHVTVHFLYLGDTTKQWNKRYFRNFKMTDEYYDSIFEKTKSKGWVECMFLDKSMGLAPSKKQFCINPAIIKDWKVFERDIVGGAKCLNILLWRGIGGGVYRSYFTENDLRFPHYEIHFALKPSEPVQQEVARFRKRFLPDRFITVYVRSEFILKPHGFNFEFLKKCIDVIVDVANALKAMSGISHVFVASDMSKYGSAVLSNYANKAKEKNPFPDIYKSLISRVGGTVYNYNATSSFVTERDSIALVDLTLLTQAQYLVTAGDETMSSFVRWVAGKFLANHREDKELWSKISVCNK
ncbi:uncharacterized protein LOC114544156 [Dendronephthya gigantea]|uniref:uncharacterized protein LOC114544156 n=1 Tax=Dendronephthya gigantea TaxID=151771 RepID=UPI00106DC44B|nr:uncharacterized protein LOC114544156 [Dendronephthya gigantea]XP_028418671.1 uncharacterized protein LOC114544156 [Dendronephthya gigantea]